MHSVQQHCSGCGTSFNQVQGWQKKHWIYQSQEWGEAICTDVLCWEHLVHGKCLFCSSRNHLECSDSAPGPCPCTAAPFLPFFPWVGADFHHAWLRQGLQLHLELLETEMVLQEIHLWTAVCYTSQLGVHFSVQIMKEIWHDSKIKHHH